MQNKLVITIGREYGSGGREIGEKLAKKLGIAYYDKKMLEILAKESGLCDEIIRTYDEKPTNSLLYSLAMNPYGFVNSMKLSQPLETQVYLSQVNLIKELAEKESCVIVGRSADSILKEWKHVMNFFIYADMDKRIERIMRIEGVGIQEANELIIKADKSRASFYNYYTNQKWGEAKNYDLCLNSSVLGVEDSIELLKDFIIKKESQK